MSFLRLSAIALFALPLAAQNHYYTTTFPATENPICEAGISGCVWVNGGTTGLQWGNAQSSPGKAFGTNINGAPPFNDSTAVLGGTWVSNQTAQATVFLDNQVGGNPYSDSAAQEEVELHTNMTVTANSITGYEFDVSAVAVDPYLVIVRWNGPLNNFTGLTSAVPLVIHNGDVLKATNVGGKLTLYVNGVAEVSATDTTYTGGSPGIGFWYESGSLDDIAHFGFSNFTAWDSVYSGKEPSAPTNLTGSAVAK